MMLKTTNFGDMLLRWECNDPAKSGSIAPEKTLQRE